MNCPNCQSEVNSKDIYCTNCGHDLSKKGKSLSRNGRLAIAILTIASALLFFVFLNHRSNHNQEKLMTEAITDLAEPEEVSESKVDLLGEAHLAIENKDYDLAVAHLADALALEYDEKNEKLKELVEQMRSVSYLYIDDELAEAYDELLAILSSKEEGEEYRLIYEQADELKEQVKDSHRLKWNGILASGLEMKFDGSNSLLDLEYPLENPEFFDEGELAGIEHQLFTYLNNDFVEKHLFEEGDFVDGVYLLYYREYNQTEKIADLAEELAAMNIPVRFYTPHRDQTIAYLANQLASLDHIQYFSESENYHLIVKGSQEPDSQRPYRTETSEEGTIAYLEEVLKK